MSADAFAACAAGLGAPYGKEAYVFLKGEDMDFSKFLGLPRLVLAKTLEDFKALVSGNFGSSVFEDGSGADKIVSAMIKVSLLELERQGQLSRRKRRRMRRQHAQRRLAADRD